MQRIVLKKEIKTKYPIEGVSLVNLEDDIDYKSCNDGIYATGVIKIDGEYYKGVRTTRFVDEIDVDIFAPMEDLVSRSDLKVRIIDFDYKIDDDLITFSVVLDIEGLKEVDKTFPTSVYEEKEEILIDDRAGNDNSDLVDEEVENVDLVVESTQDIPIKKDENIPLKSKPKKDVLKVCFTYHVVMKDDTYESISKELKIDKNKLINLNKNKELKEGTLILLP